MGGKNYPKKQAGEQGQQQPKQKKEKQPKQPGQQQAQQPGQKPDQPPAQVPQPGPSQEQAQQPKKQKQPQSQAAPPAQPQQWGPSAQQAPTAWGPPLGAKPKAAPSQQQQPQQQQQQPPQQPTPKMAPQTPQTPQTPATPDTPQTPSAADASLTKSFSKMNVQSESKGSPVPRSGVSLTMCAPKGPGTLGERLKPIETNYLKLDLKKMLKTAFHYDVKFEPEGPKKAYPKVFELYVKENFAGTPIAFDGRCNAYSAKKLDLKKIKTHKVAYFNKYTNHTREYTVALMEAKNSEISLDLLNTYKKDNRSDALTRALQCFEVIMKSAFYQAHLEAGVSTKRSFYLPGAREYLGDFFQLWYGLFQSTVLGDMPFLNIDIQHKAFPTHYEHLTELVKDVQQDNRMQPNLNAPLDRNAAEALKRHLAGLDICYKINDKGYERKFLGLEVPPGQFKFEKDGKQITIEAYLRTTYNYKLIHPHMPCIKMGTATHAITVPLELCSLSEKQALNRRCTENQTREIIKKAATTTDIRKKKIIDMLNKIKHNDAPVIRGFGIQLDSKFVQVPARKLTAPDIQYKNGTTKVINGVWSNDRQNFIHAQSGETNYAVLNFDDRTDENSLIRNIEQQAKFLNMGLNGCILRKKILQRNPRDPIDNDLNKAMHEIKGNPKIKITFCILPFRNTTKVYAKIKQVAELGYGVLTQCIKNSTVNNKVQRNDVSTLVNILLKVNAKLNGTNHVLQKSPLLGVKTMVIGADVTHPSPDQRGIPSVVGVAASHDASAFKYNTEWRLQDSTIEIIQDFRTIIKNQLRFFQKQNGNKLPEKIFYYRDGVSEGQFQFVLGEERQGIQAACRDIDSRYAPKLTIIVVQKRHHTRFFPGPNNWRPDRNNNVPAGTIVDQVITNPNESNFFLCSHASIQGVARPSKYCVLIDDGNHTMDQLQTLTYDLCHLFTRCNRSVSYPAPTYYAHLVAYRGRVYIDDDKRMNIQNLKKEMADRRINNDILGNHPMFFV